MNGRRAAEVAAGVLVLAFVAAYMREHWVEIRDYRWDPEPGLLATATLLAAAALILFGCVWTALLRALGEPLTITAGLRIWFVSNLARYVPGKVWQLSGTAYLARREGVDPVHAVWSSLLAQAIVLAVAVLLLLGALPATAARVYGRGAQLALALATAAMFALYLSPLFDRAYARAATLLRGGSPPPALGLRNKLLLGAGTALAWGVFATSFWVFLEAVTSERLPPLAAAGIFVAGYLAGFLAFFTPGGLGVREGVYVVLLGPYLPTSVALAAAILSRLWLTLVELVLASLSAVLPAGERRLRIPPASAGAPSQSSRAGLDA
ncbi:MAG: flippase-like domain-containing protein [Gemmatimonadetes bacterium]|nr:flippase-like domain-containing protein [Gemmatimonadota bacterium]